MRHWSSQGHTDTEMDARKKKKKFVDGPALQMGRATKTVCLDTAIIRCEPAQGDASTHVATSESGQLYDSKTPNASEVR